MTPRQQARLLDQLEREHGPRIRKAFEQAIRHMRARVDMTALQRAIAAGDIAAAVAAIGIAEPLFRDFETELVRAFEDAGRKFTSFFPKRLRDPQGMLVRFTFDMRHPEAERWLRREAAGLVTRIVEDQREAIREHLTEGLRRGLNPRQSALELAGRINPATKRRQGGILGLSSPQARYARDARSELLRGDPEALRTYLGRTRRDKRFDAAVKAAIREGRALPRATAEKAAGRYADRLLQTRAETVSRTETLNALRAGQHQAFTQGAEQAGLTDADVTRVWDASRDSSTRSTHAAADGQTVQGRDTPFTVGGYPMRYPGDSSMGAPASETVNCRCIAAVKVDFFGQLARQRAA